MMDYLQHLGNEGSALPDFIILGAQKAGTTSLYRYISQHRQVIPAKIKEIHYFDLHYSKGIEWYVQHFLRRDQKNSLKNITGEASPYYMFHPHALGRIHKVLPNGKFIILLRNPIDRAISHYFQAVRKGFETLPIELALRAEESRIEVDLKKMMEDEHYFGTSHMRLSYKARGVYVEQVSRCFDIFEREQIKIIKSEIFFAEPEKTLKEIFEFLGIDPDFKLQHIGPENIGYYNETVPRSVHQYLATYFRNSNEKLYELLGCDLQW